MMFEIRHNSVYANGVELSNVLHVLDVLRGHRYWIIEKWLNNKNLNGVNNITFRADLKHFMENSGFQVYQEY